VTIGVGVIVSFASLLLLNYLLRDLDFSVLREVGWTMALLILGLSVLGTALYTVAVCVLIRASGHRASLVQVYLVLTSSLSVNYVTPVKVGLPLRVFLYRHFMKIPASVGTALVAVETLVGMLTPAMAAAFGVTFLFESIPAYFPVGLLAVLVLFASVVVFAPVSLVARLANKLPSHHFTRRALSFWHEVQIGLHEVPLWVPMILAVLFCLNFVLHAIRLHVMLLGLGHSANPLWLFFALTTSVTAGNLSMIPMGLGVRDASLALLLRQLDVPSKIALSATLIQRLFSPGWPLLLGFISANILGVSEMAKNARDTKHDTP
jgi:uncharacterized protein (TIRG00374 family)